MKNKIFVLAVVLVGLVGFFVMKNRSANTPVPQPPSQTPTSAENYIRPHSPSYGNRLARATVIEWLDPECEACAAMHPIVKKIIKEYGDRVHFVIRYMPFHGNSIYAACALEEARELGKYDQAMDILFSRLHEWGDHHQPKPELIPDLLGKLGIPKEKFQREYLVQKHSEKIKIDEADGRLVGVRGTPTFFVNGQMLRQLGEEPLRLAIEEALK
jgi:protein-disulfide isomerase